MRGDQRMPGAARRRRRAAAALALLLAAAFPGAATAHGFVVAIRAEGPDAAATLAEAIRGMRLAAGERDGHADETSDGHLGGLDLFIAPQPAGIAHGVEGLKGAPEGPPDVVLTLSGSGPAIAARLATPAGPAPGGAVRPAAPADFADRHLAAYGTAPTDAAALAYGAARRIDRAVRALGGVGDPASLARALAETAQDAGR